jgi:hypothetical protein
MRWRLAKIDPNGLKKGEFAPRWGKLKKKSFDLQRKYGGAEGI